jgi:natural product precursor
MVTKKRTTTKAAKRGRVKVGKLKLNKETVKDLSEREVKAIKGGMIPTLMATHGDKCTKPTS